MTIKEYAALKGVSIQAVYQMLKRKKNKAALKGHISTVNGIKQLDDFAVKYLESKRENSPTVFFQENDKEYTQKLEEQNRQLLMKVATLQDDLIKEKELVQALQNDKMALIEEKASLQAEVVKAEKEKEAATQKRGFWSFFTK